MDNRSIRALWSKELTFDLFLLLLKTSLHLNTQLLKISQSTLSAAFGVATSSLGLLECGLQLADLAG